MPRYINADELPITTVAIQPYAISEKPYNAEVVFARFIRDAPTADVREVVHGKWIRIKEHEYRCSICGAGVGHAWEEKFCWTCGAEMSTDEDWHVAEECGADMRGGEDEQV